MTEPTGHRSPNATRLIIVRGNSGSGKSTIGRRLQRGYGRGCALVEQDHLRRVILRERDKPGGLVVGLIDQTVRYVLDGGYHVVLEGILHRAKYGPMLESLVASYADRATVVYLDVSLEETLRRHTLRPQAKEFTPEQMRGWYLDRDILGLDGEHVIGQESSMERTVQFIAEVAGLPMDQRDDDAIASAAAL